jgi:glycosyltransferase involved in cell wall biosynthesis
MCSELVSAIMGVRNGLPFIRRTLESVLAQRYRQLEVIVVDDGSTDQTMAIVEDMARHDGRLRLLSITHGGVSRARNFGIANARGSLIAPVDADDIWHPEKISRQVEALNDGSPRAGVAYCFNAEIDEDDLVLRTLTESDPPEGWVLPRLIERNFIGSASTPLIRRAYLEAAGGYDPNLRRGAEDWKLYLALAELCEFVCVPVHLVGYRKSTASMSSNVAAMENSIGVVRQWSMQRWPDLPKSHWVRQSYFTNSYLANQALSQNCLPESLRFELEALSAMPIALLYGTTFEFFLRSIIRLVGLNQTIRNARRAYLRVRHRRWTIPDAIK